MKNQVNKIFVVSVIIACLILPSHINGQSGSLDLTFGGNGIVTTLVGTGNAYAYSVAVQSDGKIVVAGHGENGLNSDFAVMRYNTDGSLDNTFDDDGIVFTNFYTGNDYGYAVAIQSDGRIVVAGSAVNGSSYDLALARYNTDGSLDESFDADGKVTTFVTSSSYSYAYSLAIQPDGKILIAGTANVGATDGLVVARYNSDGSIDDTFDADGIVVSSVGVNATTSTSIALQSDGKIVVSGSVFDGSGDVAVLMRYTENGSMDDTFGTGGIIYAPFGTNSNLTASMAIQNDGKIVLAGSNYDTEVGQVDFAIVRYNTDGGLDNTFDGDGMAFTDFGDNSEDFAKSIVIQGDGKIIVVGHTEINNNRVFAMARYNTDGSLDTGFDSDGKVATAVGTTQDEAFSVAIQNDGKIVVSGRTFINDISNYATARYNNTITIGIYTAKLNNIIIDVYPNPASSSEITLHADDVLQDATIAIFNSIGLLVKETKNISGHTITLNIEDLVSGSYIVRVAQKSKTLHNENLVIISD